MSTLLQLQEPLAAYQLDSVYEPSFDATSMPAEQLERFSRHNLAPELPTPLAVLFQLLTLGLFAPFFCASKHSSMPLVHREDFSTGKAIGFLFIPFVGIWWFPHMMSRTADRINLQFRLRGMPGPVSRGTGAWVAILWMLGIIPYLGVVTWLIEWLIVGPIFVGSVQAACERLARLGPVQPALGILPAAATQSAALPAQDQGKKCPRCAETIRLDANVCRFCGHEFDPAQIEAERSQLAAAQAAARDRQRLLAERRGRIWEQVQLWHRQKGKRDSAIVWSALLGLLVALPTVIAWGVGFSTSRTLGDILASTGVTLLLVGLCALPGWLLWRGRARLLQELERMTNVEGILYTCPRCNQPRDRALPDPCRRCGTSAEMPPPQS